MGGMSPSAILLDSYHSYPLLQTARSDFVLELAFVTLLSAISFL
jgi:hypothetical protein